VLAPTSGSPDSRDPTNAKDSAAQGSIVAILDRPASDTRISDVLAAWRTAERALAEADQNGSARQHLETTVRELRALHARLFDERFGSLDGAATAGDPSRSR
jgi:hypothetical protein